MLDYPDAMLSFRRGMSGAICAAGLLSAACAARAPQPLTAQAPPPAVAVEAAAAPTPQPEADPVRDLVALSEQYLKTGEQELRDGHLTAARAAFNRAVDVLLDVPGGARSTPQLSSHFDRLIERISDHELTALAQADVFVEKAPEPASIDDLLSIATVEHPSPTPETEKAVADDLQTVVHDIDIPLNSRVLAYVEAPTLPDG